MKTKSRVSLSFATGNGSDRSHKIFFSAILSGYGTVLGVIVPALEIDFCFTEAILSGYFPQPDNSTLHDSTVREVDLHIKKRESVQVWNTGHSGEMLQCPAADSSAGEYSPEGYYRGSVNQNNRQGIKPGKTVCQGDQNSAVLS
jgi:hypothetical protein